MNLKNILPKYRGLGLKILALSVLPIYWAIISHDRLGGEFMFTDEKGHGWLPVVGNSLVILKSPVVHKVNPVLSPIMPRISVQIFMK